MQQTDQATHTPGPWGFVVEPTEVPGVNVRFLVDSPAGNTVTSGQSQEHLQQEYGTGIAEAECRANARLIAAAPELLEALIECLECEFAVTDKAAIAKARASIAKATGAAA